MKGGKKAGVAIWISDKIDYKTKTNKRQRRALYHDKGKNLTGELNNFKYLCTQQGSI